MGLRSHLESSVGHVSDYSIPSEVEPNSNFLNAAKVELDELNTEQHEAVFYPNNPLRILAGPGAGKTRVITNRIARRINDETVDARRILALTFTRRAAFELQDRLRRKGIRDLGAVGTFHAVALAQVRQHRSDLRKKPPQILASKHSVLSKLIGDFPSLELSASIAEINWLASQDLNADDYRRGPGAYRVGHTRAKQIADLYDAYGSFKRKRTLLDFDDILIECTQLLRTDKAFKSAQHWVFRHFFVDEFQDLNQLQFNLLRQWIGNRSDLCVVGDPDQAIYGWNGADYSLLSDLTDHFPEVATLSLKANHRSHPAIVEAANAILDRPLEQNVEGTKSEYLPTKSWFKSEQDEAQGIARYLKDLRTPGTNWSGHAVLTRTNKQLEIISQVMTEFRIPHRLRGQGGIFNLADVKKIVDHLSSSASNFSSMASDFLTEVDFGPERQIAEFALQYSKDNPGASGSDFRDWLLTLQAGDFGHDFDAVDLATFHAAKGLEWPSVVIAGLEEGLVPIKLDDDEERRLLYVAISRAKSKLHLTGAATRLVGSSIQTRRPCPWLSKIATADSIQSDASDDSATSYIKEARESLGAPPQSDSDIRAQKLRNWIDTTARRRQVEPSALLPRHLIYEVAKKRPTSMSHLAEITGFTQARLDRVGQEILAIIEGE